jgi:hypothetical protein
MRYGSYRNASGRCERKMNEQWIKKSKLMFACDNLGHHDFCHWPNTSEDMVRKSCAYPINFLPAIWTGNSKALTHKLPCLVSRD